MERIEYIDQLTNLLCNSSHIINQHIHIHGTHGTGKTTTVKDVCKYNSTLLLSTYTNVSCVLNDKQLLSHIYYQLYTQSVESQYNPKKTIQLQYECDNYYDMYCDNINWSANKTMEFIHRINQLKFQQNIINNNNINGNDHIDDTNHDSNGNSENSDHNNNILSVYIVLDNISSFTPSMLNLFQSLHNSTTYIHSCNLNFITIDANDCSQLFGGPQQYNTIYILFEPYDIDEIVSIVTNRLHEHPLLQDINYDSYIELIDLIVQQYQYYTHDYKKYISMIQKITPKWIELYHESLNNSDMVLDYQLSKLTNNIQYHEYSAALLSTVNSSNKKLIDSRTVTIDDIIDIRSHIKLHSILTEQCKYILISAYLCSINPIKHDIILFSHTAQRYNKKCGGGTSKRIKSNKYDTKLDTIHYGGKSFTPDRLHAVYDAITLANNHCMNTSTTLYSNIFVLIELKCMRIVGERNNGNLLDNIKLECCVLRSEIDEVCQSIVPDAFPIDRYLFQQ